MDQDSIVPRVAFVINLAPRDSQQLSPPRLRHLIHLFRSHRVEATWAISDASMAQLLREQTGSLSADQVALNLHRPKGDESVSSRAFAKQLSQELSRVAAVVGSTPSVVLGRPSSLRSYTVLLSQLGIDTIISDGSEKEQNTRPRSLPCGVWQMSPQMQLPRTRLLERLTLRGPSVREMIASAVGSTMLVAVSALEVEKLSARGMQSFEKLVQQVSWAGSRGQIEPTTLTEIVGDLRRQRQVKPQRSIMRVAA